MCTWPCYTSRSSGSSSVSVLFRAQTTWVGRNGYGPGDSLLWEHSAVPSLLEVDCNLGFEGPVERVEEIGQWPAGPFGAVGLLALPTSAVCLGQSSVHLSFCICLFLVLPSLSAPTLVSSSLICWQDDGTRLPVRSPQPEVCPRRGCGEWLATAWPSGPQSKLTDTLFPV